jgi:hypothetical protein
MSAQPDLEPGRRNADPEVRKAWIGAGAVVLAAVISTVVPLLVAGWLQYRGPGSAPPPAGVPAEIITPVDGERVGLCPAIRGIAAPAEGDVAYWLALQDVAQGIEHPRIYLVARITVNPRRMSWDLGKIRIARPDQIDQDFYVLLVRSTGDLTREFADRIEQNSRYLSRSDAGTVVDQIRVTQTAEPAC